MKTVTALAGCALAAGMIVSSGSVLAGACGHNVNGKPTIEVTELGENTSVISYFSPATIIMDDPSDPRHRAFGECRGQGVVIDGVANWTGACIWKREDGAGEYVAHWSSRPSDRGVERREALHGTARLVGSGNLAFLTGRTTKWSALANGGSYFCED
jgi:hypothetical protein